MSINPPDGAADDDREPVVPPVPFVPPEQPAAPPPIEQPPAASAPPPPAPQIPAQPTMPAPQYVYPPQYQPQPGRLGNGAKIGIGTGIGCASYVLAFFLFLAAISALPSANAGVYFAVFSIPALIGIGLLFSPRSRGFGVGILIVSAAAWLVVIGPCSTLLL